MAELREVRLRDEVPPAPLAPPQRGRLALAIPLQRPSPEDPERNRLIEKSDGVARLDMVPMWLYEPLTVGFWAKDYKCVKVRITKAAFLWWSNCVCFVAHTSFASVSAWVSMKEDGTMDTPLLAVYTTDLLWVANTTDALVPRFQKTGSWYLSWMVFSFFALSAVFHLIVVVLNANQSFVMRNGLINDEARKVTPWPLPTGWYLTGIHDCRNPLRWIEYAFSASLMAMIFAITSGLNHIYIVVMIFGLMFCTMAFGWVSEVYNRPYHPGDDTKPLYWRINEWKVEDPKSVPTPDVKVNDPKPVPNLSYRLQRLLPYFLGWVPYLFAWVPLLHSFFWTVQNAQEGTGPPSFVYAIVISQFVLFSLFGLAQFSLLVRVNGPDWYYLGEWSYLLLSLVAKGVLGSILIANVLIYSSLDQAMQRAG